MTFYKRIADRERSPMYQVGDVHRIIVLHLNQKTTVLNQWIALEDFFGSSPKVVMTDKTSIENYTDLGYDKKNISTYLEQVLQLAVACKDWLTNKVDRCVGGK
jgi:phosphoribosylformylglycinamidine synthase